MLIFPCSIYSSPGLLYNIIYAYLPRHIEVYPILGILKSHEKSPCAHCSWWWFPPILMIASPLTGHKFRPSDFRLRLLFAAWVLRGTTRIETVGPQHLGGTMPIDVVNPIINKPSSLGWFLSLLALNDDDFRDNYGCLNNEGLWLAIALEIGWCKITTSIIFFLGLYTIAIGF